MNASATPPDQTVERKEFSVSTADEFALQAVCFEPVRSRKVSLLICAATATPQRFYSAFATHMATLGYRVYTFDYRGIGKSRPASLKGFDAHMHQWALQDLPAMIRHIRAAHSSERLLGLGHSVGGQIMGLTAESQQLDGMVFTASQLGYWGLWPAPKRYVFWFGVHVYLPLTSTLFGYYPGNRLRIMRDMPKGVAKEWSKWCRSPNYLFDYYSDEHYQKLEIPLLSLSFSDDSTAPRKAVSALLDRYPRAKITRMHVRPEEVGLKFIGHFGFFRKPSKEQLWPKLTNWLEAQGF